MSEDTPAVDRNALRERYSAERDKRLRTAGTDQYHFAEGRFARFDADPYAPAETPRDAVTADIDVLVIGCGFGGIEMGVTLGKAGIDNFRMVDVAADFGGTWYWNRYPGLRCDVESYIYLPYLEETGHMPTERYVRGSEILDYCRILGSHFGLYERALFQTRITALRWDDDVARWIVETSRGDTLRARFVTTQSGIFSRPQLPGISGIEDFAGHSFHSARWDYNYTGGGPDQPLSRLADKRVGIIGTGTTALQVVPEVAMAAESLTVFQRTPTAVGVRDNGLTDPAWFASLGPGWQKTREVTFNQLANGEDVDCPVDDGWARFFRRMNAATAAVADDPRDGEAIVEAQEQADFEHNEIVRARVDALVADPRKADALKAYYRTQCKRPGFSDEYLQVFNQANVDIVDVSGGVDKISPDGVVVAGVEYPLDCIIFCTGFELGTGWSHQAGYEVTGRCGRKLSEKWADGVVTYHGLFSHGFPNMFFMGLTQTGTTISVPHMLQEQVDHIVHIVAQCLAAGVATVETTQTAEAEWQDAIEAVNVMRRPFQEACTPGYFNAEGKSADRRSAIGSGIFFPSTHFFAMLAEIRKNGDFPGLVFGKRIQAIES